MKKLLLLVAALLSFALPSFAQDQQLPNSTLPFVATLPATCTPGITGSVELSTTPYSINYCSATNVWSALTAASGSTWSSLPGGTNSSSAFLCGTGCSIAPSGSGVVTASNGINSVTSDTNVTGAVSGGVLTIAWAGTAAKTRLPATGVYTDQANTFGAFAQDFSGSSLFKVRAGPLLTTTVLGEIGYDTSNNNLHAFINSADSFLWRGAVSGSYINNDCSKFSVSAGSISIVDAGISCNNLPVGPTSPNGVISNMTSTPSSGLAGPPVWTLPGLTGRDLTGTATLDTILATDCNPMPVFYQGSASVAVTLPTATALGVAKCTLKLTNNTSGAATTVTVTPTTWTIAPGGTSLVIAQGQSCLLTVDSTVATQWNAICADEPVAAGAGIAIARTQYGHTISATGSGVGACAANTWVSTLVANAAPTCTQPAFSNLSGVATAAQLPVFVASGASHAAGAVPDPGVTAGTTRFLREDATWAVPAGGGGSFDWNAKRRAYIVAQCSGALPGFGLNIGTITGNTYAGVCGSSTLPVYTKSTSAATINADAGFDENGNHNWRTADNPFFFFYGLTLQTVTMRWSFGLVDATGAVLVNSSTPTTSGAYFSYDTASAVDTTHFLACTGNAAAAVCASTGVLADTNFHKFSITITSGTNCVFAIDGATTNTITTNLPANTTILQTVNGIQTLAAAAASIGTNRLYVEATQ